MQRFLGVFALALMLAMPALGARAVPEVSAQDVDAAKYDIRVDIQEPSQVRCTSKTDKQNNYTWKVTAKCDNDSSKTKEVTLKVKLKEDGDQIDKCKRTEKIKANRSNYEFSCTVRD